MYTGAEFGVRDPEHSSWRYYKADMNESPVNLFNPDLQQFPHFRLVDNQYSQVLKAGDCVFVPAFYFYQLAAEAEIQA